MFDKYLPNMNPRKRYNGEINTPGERKFMSDAISYRMGPIRLRQIRTKGKLFLVVMVILSSGLLFFCYDLCFFGGLF